MERGVRRTKCCFGVRKGAGREGGEVTIQDLGAGFADAVGGHYVGVDDALVVVEEKEDCCDDGKDGSWEEEEGTWGEGLK